MADYKYEEKENFEGKKVKVLGRHLRAGLRPGKGRLDGKARQRRRKARLLENRPSLLVQQRLVRQREEEAGGIKARLSPAPACVDGAFRMDGATCERMTRGKRLERMRLASACDEAVKNPMEVTHGFHDTYDQLHR